MNMTAVMTCHREGLYAGPSLVSYREAIEHARGYGLSVEPIIILDQPDELTRSIISEDPIPSAVVLTTDFGDPAVARMFAVAKGSGDFVTFLDADDVWSFNWLTEATAFLQKEGNMTVANSELIIAFGAKEHVWIHADSQWEDFDFEYLRISNYWDAMCYAAREVFELYPMRKNDIKAGYGHEDWHWNCLTYSAGYRHRPVPGTVHFKRSRPGSQSAICLQSDVVPWPTQLTSYAWDPHKPQPGKSL